MRYELVKSGIRYTATVEPGLQEDGEVASYVAKIWDSSGKVLQTFEDEVITDGTFHKAGYTVIGNPDGLVIQTL